ncbi:flagellar hook-basal body complex protein [Ectobacillus sp. sgz5001026]|uniref:flagellar hook-basal body complex protein n=1 Tax=Ectobacillus sp. sgz5001026 TaxID=3242473 RepID=UPI0036D2E578
MLRSLNAGVSGLKAFQSKLDVVGNNIANVNTVGFKKSRIMFEDLLSQNMKGASAPTATMGGTNPLQVGLGTKVGTIDTIQTAGSPTTTGLSTDLYINGNGYFVVKDSNGNQFLTRAGNFSVDSVGNLVNPDGMIVDGVNISQANLGQYLSYSVAADGQMKGIRANGSTDPLGTIHTVTVPNPSGLNKIGGSLYQVSLNSGSMSNSGVGVGPIVSGALEMSNVDLTEEMTDMITAQRGFQANGKIITTSDDILNELINLKR